MHNEAVREGYSRDIVRDEAPFFRNQYDLVAGLLRSGLEKTALVDPKKNFSMSDVEASRKTILELAPYFPPRVDSGFISHLVITSILNRELAKQIPELEIDPFMAECLGLIHDAGRFISPHRYLLNDAFAHGLLRRVDIREDVLSVLPLIPAILGVKKLGNKSEILTLEDFTPVQRALDWADNFSKLGPGKKRLLTVEEWIQRVSSQPKRYYNTAWPLEAEGVNALLNGKQDLAIELTKAEIEWLTNVCGLDLNALTEDVTNLYFMSDNQKYIFDVNSARESLDPVIDKELGKAPIKTIVFDIGNVLWEDADPSLIQALADYFGVSFEQASQALTYQLDKAFAGQISEADYLKGAWEKMGRLVPSNIEPARAPFIQPQIYIPKPGMQDLIKELINSGSVDIYFLSNIIAPLGRVVREKLREFYPEIDLSKVYFSYNLGASKKDPNGALYKRFHEQVLGNPEPTSVLHIDDIARYMDSLRANVGARGFTFVDDPFRNIPAPERLKAQLRLAKCIQ